MPNFQDRTDASQKLAHKLIDYQKNSDTIIIGVVRGGLVVASEVAKFLELPLDFIVVRKIGCPNNRELGAGAITQMGEIVFKEAILKKQGLVADDFKEIIEEELAELQRRKDTFREYQKEQSIKGKTYTTRHFQINRSAS
ncbi:phosphoribosyltransferase family protein [Bernardetia sp. OM2101]|uniref:phosphoribosyltransferase family protein n=1 Tax=Bernardetia sp. OM2101 TaxID=3344876 RepID=UPI0035CF75B8